MVLARPVSIIVAVIVAPGRAALVPSTTLPIKVASWAKVGEAKRNREARPISETNRIRIAHSVSALTGQYGADYISFHLSTDTMTAAMTDSKSRLILVSAARWRLAVILTTIMTLVYVGFILLIAFNKPLLGTVLMPGLSLGILLGVLVIVTAWALIVIYVKWANEHYDATVADIRRAHQEGR